MIYEKQGEAQADKAAFLETWINRPVMHDATLTPRTPDKSIFK